MAEFDLKLKENDSRYKLVLALMTVLFPLWGLIIPGVLILFIALLLSLPSSISIWSSFSLILGFILIISISALFTLFLEDDEIKVSKGSIRFPLRYFFSLKRCLEYSWDELDSVKLDWQREKKFTDTCSLSLIFQNSAIIKLYLKRFSLEQLEQFFIAFEACSNIHDRDADLDDLEFAIQNANKNSSISYTQLWDRSLSGKFSGTTFVPVEPGAYLQDKHYQVIRQLAFGGFSAVYLAKNKQGKNILLKESIIQTDQDKKEKIVEMFKREAEILAKLEHNAVAKFYDYFIENSRHYMSMEYIDGLDLNRLILKNGPQKVDDILNWSKQLLEVLSYLHNRETPIIHRDLTPDNVILRKDLSIALVDFGAAKTVMMGVGGTIIGKQAYMSPEQFQGYANIKSDVYSFGACLYFLLTAQAPLALSQSNPQLVRKDVPDCINEIVLSCTNLDENLRPDTNELLHKLKKIEISSGV